MRQQFARVVAFVVVMGVATTLVSFISIGYGSRDPAGLGDAFVTACTVASWFFYPVVLNLNWWLTFGLLFFVFRRFQSTSASA
jgi:hypothetical protein